MKQFLKLSWGKIIIAFPIFFLLLLVSFKFFPDSILSDILPAWNVESVGNCTGNAISPVGCIPPTGLPLTETLSVLLVTFIVLFVISYVLSCTSRVLFRKSFKKKRNPVKAKK